MVELTAVSSIVLSPSSHLPPGNEVSPAYVRRVLDRLMKKYIVMHSYD